VSDAEFERRIAAAIRSDVVSAPDARARVMQRVREAARTLPHRRDPVLARGARHSIVGLALAASIGSITTLSSLLPVPVDAARGSIVLGDTVVSTLRDTLRLVRLMFDAPTAAHVAAVGTFDGQAVSSTPLVRDPATNRWTATLALRDGTHRYAFVVDGTRWVPDPWAERVRADDGRLYSLLHVARATN
jgi:hypothetical protein